MLRTRLPCSPLVAKQCYDRKADIKMPLAARGNRPGFLAAMLGSPFGGVCISSAQRCPVSGITASINDNILALEGRRTGPSYGHLYCQPRVGHQSIFLWPRSAQFAVFGGQLHVATMRPEHSLPTLPAANGLLTERASTLDDHKSWNIANAGMFELEHAILPG